MTIFLLFAISLFIYLFSNLNSETFYNYFIFLAEAFLHGRLYVVENFPWLNELVKWQGHFYVVYPPMPAILLIPFVGVFGVNFHQSWLSIFLAAVNVSLSYLVFLKAYKIKQIALWISILYAFGTMQWYHAIVGSAWYIAHIVALFFLWLALLEILTRQRLILIGILIGFAYLARLPTILSVTFVLLYLHHKFINFEKKKILIRNIILFGIGLLPAILFNFLYNFLRFGVIYDISYTLLPVFNEPWYRYGLFSIRYIPTHVKEILTALPKLIPTFPYIVPSLNVMALWVVTPAFLLIPWANYKEKIVWISLVTVLVMSIPSLTHGENGFSQFGFRFALDYLPFLLMLIASALVNRLNLWTKSLIVLSILVNLWGVIMISFLNIWTI